jgi:hypothetical protein
MGHPTEPVLREYENWEGGSSSVQRDQARFEGESRVPLLAAAVQAIGGDAAARVKLGAPAAVPGFAWTLTRPDLFVGLMKQHAASADTVFYADERHVLGVAAATGDLRFALQLNEIQDASPITLTPFALAVEPGGALVMAAGVIAKQGRRIPEQIVAAVDPESGELVRVAAWPERAVASEIEADLDGVDAGADARALRVAWDGQPSWSAELDVPWSPYHERSVYVRAGAGRVALVGGGWLELRDRAGRRLARVAHPRDPDLDAPFASGGSDVVLTARTIYFLAGDGSVYAFEPDGHQRWRRPHPKREQPELRPARACGDSLCVPGDGELMVYTPDGAETRHVLPPELLDVFTSDREVLALGAGPADDTGHRRDVALYMADLAGHAPRTVRAPAQAERLLAATDHCVVVTISQGIGCLPR